MGQGKGHQARLAAMRGGGGAPPTSEALAQQLAKQLNMPTNVLKAAAFVKSLEKAQSKQERDMRTLMKGLTDKSSWHGHGSLGQITLRMGLPRAKVKDFADVLTPLTNRGVISVVVPRSAVSGNSNNAQIEVQSTITRAQLKKLSHVSSDVLVSLLDTFRNEI